MLKDKRIIIGSDKSGFELKEAVKAHLSELGLEVTDDGTLCIEKFQPFYEVAPKVAKRVQSGEFEKGLLICGTGAGMCMLANKFEGVYAVAAESEYTAEQAAIINDANILTMGGWVVTPQVACRMVDLWLGAEFMQGIPAERQIILNNAKNTLFETEAQSFKTR